MQRTVLIEFASAEEAVAAYSSSGYQEALTALGAKATERDIRIIEGFSDEAKTQSILGRGRPAASLPQGYRQGIITAIGAVLGFTLLLIRYWSFEAPGGWTPASATAGLLMAVATMLEIFVLYRSLQITDDDQTEYRKTVRWFVVSAGVLLGSLLLATLAFSNVIPFSLEEDWARIWNLFR